MLVDRFMGFYGGGIEVGVPLNAGYSIIFTSAVAILNYLPSSGAPGSLTADLVDPTSTSSGLLGAYVLALQLNGKEVPKTVDTGCALVTKENLDTPEIKKVLGQ